jgi:hypothetical protein
MALRVATIGGALAELLGEAAALVPSQKAKSQLDRAAANASIAGTGKPAPALADFVRRAGQTGITGDSSAIAQVTRQGLMRDPLASSLTAAPEGVQTLAAAATLIRIASGLPAFAGVTPRARTYAARILPRKSLT